MAMHTSNAGNIWEAASSKFQASLSYIVNETFSQNIKISKQKSVGGEKPPHLLQQHLTLAVPEAQTESCWDTPFWLLSTSGRSPIRQIHQEKEYTRRTAASLAALRKSKATPQPRLISGPLQFKTQNQESIQSHTGCPLLLASRLQSQQRLVVF